MRGAGPRGHGAVGRPLCGERAGGRRRADRVRRPGRAAADRGRQAARAGQRGGGRGVGGW